MKEPFNNAMRGIKRKRSERKVIELSILQKLRKEYPNDADFGAKISELLLKQS